MGSITVHVRLHGELSCYGATVHPTGKYSSISVKLSTGSRLADLLEYLLMCTSERGFTFIDDNVSAMPNVQQDLDYQLQDGDQVIFFPAKMWPTKVQFDSKLTDKMTRTVRADENLNLYYFYE
jgi:molybdopterin converting factor small subunit